MIRIMYDPWRWAHVFAWTDTDEPEEMTHIGYVDSPWYNAARLWWVFELEGYANGACNKL
jgi:hypothetical protein